MKTIKTLAELKEAAIAITHPIKVRWPQLNQEEILTVDSSDLVENTYNMNNGIVAFFTDGTLHVIPYTKNFMDVLLEKGTYKPWHVCTFFKLGLSGSLGKQME